MNSTHIELATLREQILELSAAEEDDVVSSNEEAQLQRAQQSIIALVEYQQQLRLATSIHREESMSNGHLDDDSEDLEEQLDLYGRLEEEQQKRVALVEEYSNALSMAGMGERGELYRKLTAKCLGLKEDEVDAQLDSLISVLEEDRMDADGNDPILIR